MNLLIRIASGLLPKDHNEKLTKHLVQTNVNGLMFFCLDLALAAVFAFLHVFPIATLLCVSAFAFLIGSIGLNSLGLFNLSRISTVSIGSMLVAGCSFYLGKTQMAHASLLLGGIFPFLYFDLKERWQITVSLSVPVVCYVALVALDFHLGPQISGLSHGHELILESVFMLVPFLGIVGNIHTAVLQREQAMEQLTASREQIKALFQALSHDFSTPLSVAQMTMMKYTDGNLTEKDFVRVGRALKNLHQMLIRFKSLANVFVGKRSIEMKSVDLAKLIGGVHSTLDEQLKRKQVNLIYINETRDSDLQIAGDATVLEFQIFQNLIHNAIKFSMPMGVIKVIARDIDNETVSVSVVDAGLGMPTSKLAKLFQWTQATTTIGSSGEVGSGFGLPIVKMCLDTMGCAIRVESVQHVNDGDHSGTKFEMTFKRMRADAITEEFLREAA